MSDGAGDLFNEYAAGYEEALANAIAPSGENRGYFAEGRVSWLRRCVGEIREPVGSILDFGCGDGATTPLLLRSLDAKSAIGVDISAKSLDIARKRQVIPGIRYAPLAEFQPRDEIDLAYCNGVFHHIHPMQRGSAVEIVHRALRPGGLFSFWENSPWSLATRYVMSRCAFDRDAILLSPPEARGLLRSADFEILRTDFRFIFPKFLRVLRKTEDWLFRVPLGTQYQILCRRIR